MLSLIAAVSEYRHGHEVKISLTECGLEIKIGKTKVTIGREYAERFVNDVGAFLRNDDNPGVVILIYQPEIDDGARTIRIDSASSRRHFPIVFTLEIGHDHAFAFPITPQELVSWCNALEVMYNLNSITVVE